MEPEAPAKPREPTLPRRTGICNDNFPPKIAACVRPSRRTQRTAREKKKSRRKLSTGRLNRPSGAFFPLFSCMRLANRCVRWRSAVFTSRRKLSAPPPVIDARWRAIPRRPSTADESLDPSLRLKTNTDREEGGARFIARSIPGRFLSFSPLLSTEFEFQRCALEVPSAIAKWFPFSGMTGVTEDFPSKCVDSLDLMMFGD